MGLFDFFRNKRKKKELEEKSNSVDIKDKDYLEESKEEINNLEKENEVIIENNENNLNNIASDDLENIKEDNNTNEEKENEVIIESNENNLNNIASDDLENIKEDNNTNEEKEDYLYDKYKKSLDKTRKNFFKNILRIFSKNRVINDSFYDDLEELFITSDFGYETCENLINILRENVEIKKDIKTDEIKELLVENIYKLYSSNNEIDSKIKLNDNDLSIILFVGVNGVGKTTSIAKLAYKYKQMGKKVLVAAGDTFRAGAIEQLSEWADRINVDIVKMEAGSDPSAVIYNACQKAKDEKYDILLCDTAGRLQTKVNLMNELSKIKKVIDTKAPNSLTEVLLIVDATTGQNGLNQAKAFNDSTNITGIILTKLDGTSKGGIVIAIKEKFNIPIKFIGLGEKLEDLEIFDIKKYLYGLFYDFFS